MVLQVHVNVKLSARAVADIASDSIHMVNFTYAAAVLLVGPVVTIIRILKISAILATQAASI